MLQSTARRTKTAPATGAGRAAHGAAVLAALLALAGCGAEPDEAAIRAGLELMHREWAEQVRQGDAAAVAAPAEGSIAIPRVNLAAEARLDLQITEVRKLDCRPAPEPKPGYVCSAEVVASTAGHKSVSRRLEGRFISGGSQWVVRDLRPLDVN